MFRILLLSLVGCSLLRTFSCQQVDFNVCPNGFTTAPSDPEWPRIMPNRFEIFAEMTTNIGTFEVTQLFVGSHRDMIHLHDFEKDLQFYYDFDINEILNIDHNSKCDRFEIQRNEHVSFITSHYLKPSILLGFDGRNNYGNGFYTRFIGNEVIRDGIRAKKFQSCFYLNQRNMTINATYYISESPPNDMNPNAVADFVQIDIRTNTDPYTYNIIRYQPNPGLYITTPTGVYCPNRTSVKEFPKNLPPRLLLHSEAYTRPTMNTTWKIESFSRYIDETLDFERIDYSLGKIAKPPLPDQLLIDYATNLNYLYTRETRQCVVVNGSNQSMATTSEILFGFGMATQSMQFQYTGIVDCEREYVRCHRWIGQRNLNSITQQYEWYWSATYNDIDLSELIPIKVTIATVQQPGSLVKVTQENNLFNYDTQLNSVQIIDSTLGECYRALGPSHNYNYAVLRMTLNNDAKYPIHQHLISLESELHLQLANDLKIRHVRLSSFSIDATRDTTDHQDKDVYVTFTLLDNPPALSNSLNELPSLALIRHLARQINDGRFHVRDADGAFDLQARPNSLKTLVLYLLPSENHTNYFNETVFVYHNITQTVTRPTQKIVYTSTGSLIAALWTGFTLLGFIIAIAVGSFIAIKKWTPVLGRQAT